MMERIITAARGGGKRIVLAEGEDPRVIEGVARAAADDLAKIVLVGNDETIRKAATELGHEISGIEIADPATSIHAGEFVAAYQALRGNRISDVSTAREAMLNPLNFAAMMVRQGKADGTIGGAVATTAETVRAALLIIGKAVDADIVSSFFLMNLTGDHLPRQGPVVFADCGLVADPGPAELAEIAIASAANYRALTGASPRVAMLSFSTMGSARHASATKMIEATEIARAKKPDLLIDGELQFDAAFMPDVANTKAPGSPLEGAANVFVFPDLNSGNIAYKIAQRIGGAQAIGPVLQGLTRPANDLSRGCSAEDVYHMIALTALQAGQTRA